MAVIAVASGKGGAGKTTVSVNIAYIIATGGGGVQYLDCDVEEPNGGLFLKPVITQQYSACIETPRVDSEKCTLCGKCAEFCRFNAMAASTKAVLVFEQLCHSCGGCKLICPAGAIEYRQKEIGIIRKGSAGSIEFCDGILNITDIHSPALIGQVKQNINRGKTVIIDCPPGTGCAAVESMKDADYILLVAEPTPFGVYDFELTVKTVKKLNIRFGVVVNKTRQNQDNSGYFRQRGFDVLAEMPFDRQISEICSRAEIAAEKMADCGEKFKRLAEILVKKQ